MSDPSGLCPPFDNNPCGVGETHTGYDEAGKPITVTWDGSEWIFPDHNEIVTVDSKYDQATSVNGCGQKTGGECSDADSIRSSITRIEDFGLGWTGRVDPFSSGAGFEIHVWDKSGNERGLVSGRDGWIGKHGNAPRPPDGIPRPVLNKIHGLNVSELRRRGEIPLKGAGNIRGGSYLTPGRLLFGLPGLLNLGDGMVLDLDVYKRAKENGITFNDQLRRDNQGSGPYIQTILGPLPNPYWGTD